MTNILINFVFYDRKMSQISFSFLYIIRTFIYSVPSFWVNFINGEATKKQTFLFDLYHMGLNRQDGCVNCAALYIYSLSAV